jgi:hypothetical protein
MPDIILNPGKTVLSRNGFSLAIREFPQWYQRRLKSAKDLLQQLLCGFHFPDLEAIITRKLNPEDHKHWFFDDLPKREPGYSFLTDPKNELLQFKFSLTTKILEDADVRNRFHFLDVDEKLNFKSSKSIASNE